jgi:porin
VLRANLRNDWYIQAGVYEVNPDFQQHKYRFAFGKPFDGPGTREVVEIGWLPKSAGPEGGYRLGAWYDDVGGDDVYFNTDGAPLATQGGVPLRRHNQHGFYAMAQQRVWTRGASDTRSISVFANFVQTDRHIASIGQIAEIGLFWTGPFDARPRDDLGVAVGRVHVNSLIARGEELYNSELATRMGLSPIPIAREEYPAEIYYSVNVTPAITFRPNIQFIHAPGGVNERTDILVFGAHLAVQL